MATWSAHVIPEAVLESLSKADWNNAALLNQVKDSDVEDAAKRTFVTHIMAKIGDVVLKEGSEDAFFDKVADEAALADRTNQALGHLYWFHHYGENASKAGRGKTLEEKRDFHMKEAKVAIAAFCKTAPVVIGTHANRDRQAYNVAFVTGYDRIRGTSSQNIIAN